jgi:sugar phosphate isomerase/epimerase
MTRLALHTWTLDSTPLADALRAARTAGWDAVELRRIDFDRAAEAGQPPERVLDLVRAAGLPVACVGAQPGWMFSGRNERTTLLAVLDQACRWAVALGCRLVMSPVDRGRGDLRRAADRLKEAGDIAARYGVRLAIEAGSQSEQFNRIEPVRELLDRAGHPHCGLLVDAYHAQRAGDWPVVERLVPAEIFYVQYSDVPPETRPGFVLDRLPPGRGVVPFREAFRLLLTTEGYDADISYEAPNEAAWMRDPLEVACEALSATRAHLPA